MVYGKNNEGYIFRLYPTNKQIELIEKSFGCSRYIYNYFLKKNKNYINSYESTKELPNLVKENKWLKEVKIKGYRKLKEIKGRIINATIEKQSNKYYVSICVEELIMIPKLIPTKIIGLDLGIKDLVITSDGETIENKYIIGKYENKIKGLNRWLARSKVGSKNRYKIKKKLQVVYKKLKNARKYLLHSISNKIIKENDVIVTEKLNIKCKSIN